ncbi:MAG: hypothetical protein ACK4SA_17765, partial [Caldilinea sp.]
MEGGHLLEIAADDELDERQQVNSNAQQIGQTDDLVGTFHKEWVEEERSTFEAIKATFHQPFIPISEDGLFPGQFIGWRIGDIDTPAKGLLMGSQGGGIAFDRSQLIAHRDFFLLGAFSATAPAPDIADAAGFLAFKR